MLNDLKNIIFKDKKVLIRVDFNVPIINGLVQDDFRIIRSLVLTLRESQYVEAARAIGAQPLRILFIHIFPQTIAPIVVAGTYIFANSILTEAGLSFLGTGIPPTTPSWGNQMGESRIYASISSWTIFFPGLMVALMVLAVNLVGDGLRDALDPKLRRRG